jgi:hypothetical protein
MAVDHLLEEVYGGRFIPILTQQQVDRLTLLIHRAVEIATLILYFDIGFIDSPRWADRASIFLPLFLKGGNEALDPSHNGGMCDRDTALRLQIAHIVITQFISGIPSHGLNDKKMVEMAAFEECGLLRSELGHAGDYPWLLSLRQNPFPYRLPLSASITLPHKSNFAFRP